MAYTGFGLINKFTSIHDRLATKMNKCIQKTEIPEWMTKGMTTVIQKDSLKRTAPNNYSPIMCFPMMWKILTAQIWEIYYSLMSRGIFPAEQKGGHKRTRGTEEHLLNESKTRQKNLATARIDCEKDYDMVLQSCLRMYKILDQIVQFIENTMQPWRVELTAGEKYPKRHIPGRCTITITITIFNSHDATQSYT